MRSRHCSDEVQCGRTEDSHKTVRTANKYVLVTCRYCICALCLLTRKQNEISDSNINKRNSCVTSKCMLMTINQYLQNTLKATRSSADADKPARCVKKVKVIKHSTIPYGRYSFLLCNSNFIFKMCRFADIQLQKCCDLENRVRGSIKVIGNVTVR